MKDSYFSIKEASEGFYKEKGSKFISIAYPVDDEETIKNIIDNIKNKYHDARHHCYAFVLGINQEQERTQDAGEPPHSAGDPILRQIKAANLTNILVVVVRYFGGTKLGISGLINAYKTAAASAIANGKVVEKIVGKKIHVRFDYHQMNDVMRWVNEYAYEINDQEFMADCSINFSVKLSQVEEIIHKLELLNLKSIQQFN